MRQPRFLRLPLVTALMGLAPLASAHVSLDQGATHQSRYGDDFIKQGPCGQQGGARGTNVYTYRPGETITVEAVEYIAHPGYFRIAFDDDGDDDFVDPQSVLPLNRECMNVPEDHCGEEDFFNTDAVLLDNLDPHVPTDIFARVTYSWQVTLPNVTCDNCTLQLIQVMTDAPGVHAPYNPNEPNADDIYFQCIDLVLEGEPVPGAPAGDGGAAGAPGGSDTARPDGGPGNGGAGGLEATTAEAGCSCELARPSQGRGAWLAALAALWLTTLRRRRR